jgi:DNA-binding transcriptional MerR regulator
MSEVAQLRIGELARRTGVATDLLRAWERRYGLLEPTRTESGYRLYSTADVRRVGRMRELLATGVSAAEAAREALSEPAVAEPADLEGVPVELGDAIRRLDDAAAHAAFDRLLADFSLDAVLDGAVLPLLRELGEGWEKGEVSIAQEHFASHLVRGRLLGLARGWDRGSGPRAVLASPPQERHDLGLLIFGLALREHGWRITFLGGDTPWRRWLRPSPARTGRRRAGRHRRRPVRRGRRAAPLSVRRRSGSLDPALIRTSPSGPAPDCSTFHRSPRRRSSRRSRSRARARAGRRPSRGGGSAAHPHR